MRKAALHALASLEIDCASDSVCTIFDRGSAFGHARFADQSGGQQAQIDPSIPWNRQWGPIEEHLRLAFFRTADARHRLTARIGAHRDPGYAAQHIGQGARLAIDHLISADDHLRRQYASGCRRSGHGD